jgi:hypothetical protein
MRLNRLVNLQMNYRLAKQGFMKQFDGTWKVEPLYIDAEGSPVPEDVAERVASVFLQQVNFENTSSIIDSSMESLM